LKKYSFDKNYRICKNWFIIAGINELVVIVNDIVVILDLKQNKKWTKKAVYKKLQNIVSFKDLFLPIMSWYVAFNIRRNLFWLWNTFHRTGFCFN
jgi:hypothetical protein